MIEYSEGSLEENSLQAPLEGILPGALVTHTAAKLEGSETWIHTSQVKEAAASNLVLYKHWTPPNQVDKDEK